MAIEEFAVVAVEVHPAAEAIFEHPARGALPAPRPLPVAERKKTVLPHLPETVAVDVALVEIRTDRRAARDRPIDPHGGHRDPGGTLVEVVADLACQMCGFPSQDLYHPSQA